MIVCRLCARILLMKKILGPIILLLVLQACVAVWGESFKVIASNEKSISIKYDSLLGQEKIFEIAATHCLKYDKVAVPTTKSHTQLLGIDIQNFVCE